jgi:hypothetical protein
MYRNPDGTLPSPCPLDCAIQARSDTYQNPFGKISVASLRQQASNKTFWTLAKGATYVLSVAGGSATSRST